MTALPRPTTRPRARLRALYTVSCGAVAALTVATWWVGWWSPARPWPDAIGLSSIPALDRPAAGPAWAEEASGVPAPELEWLGHSGFVVRWQGVTILLDPNASAWCTVARRRLRPPPDLRAIGEVDAVLVSHAHRDHLDLPTVASLGGSPLIALPAGAERYLPDAGRAMPVRAGDAFRVGAIEVNAVTAAHNGDRRHPLRSDIGAVGYVLRAGDEAIYFAGDTGFANDFEAIGRRFHPRLAILPIGAWSPRLPMRYYHLSPEEAVEAALRLGAATVVPCHFGTFTLALDRPDRALPRFAAAARRRGVRWVLAPLYGERGAGNAAAALGAEARR